MKRQRTPSKTKENVMDRLSFQLFQEVRQIRIFITHFVVLTKHKQFRWNKCKA